MGDNTTEKYVAIEACEGGFVIRLNDKTIVATSLNKTMKTVREFLAEPGSTTEGE